MQLTATSLVTQAATSAADSPQAAAVLVLRKALQWQQQSAQALLQAVPPAIPTAPTGTLPLASEGPLGTRLNVMA
ncbi:MAG: hypothetical protein RMK34_03355 [Tepidimonas sp.]|uniref:hypothetical protein n=1 Tax=Tepidimonas sp. TaxID=2002775 RepID=UPI00298F2172|nr:hypothetical protein [Tepidimonas sp.]MDW8335987.1 hypothetical protein [Tepidimonas sp.]